MKLKLADLGLGIFVIFAVIIMIIQLPSLLLDIFITFNLLFALMLLFNAIFAKEALNMSSFPTILLFITIFRLALNVQSTRQILSTGYAGNVIQVFGAFVGAGNIVIGILIFIILLIIQFMVITKGAERVAEVAARFTLDAMPGKQMAVDADLNSGLINEDDARKRRRKISDEASFYGSMDGASKFVKGDAIAGLIITFINIVGGLIIGMLTDGLSFNESLVKYSILTIGDGLVSQIPALLIALSTGIIVTKVSDDSDISDLLIKQLFSLPKAFYLGGGVLVFLGIFTPLNKVIVIGMGVLAIISGRTIENTLKTKEIEHEIKTEDSEIEEIRKPENVTTLLNVDSIELEFGYGIIPLADVSHGGDLLDRVVMIRRQIALELGTIVPIIRLRDNIQLNPNQYVIKIKGTEIATGNILFNHYMAMNPGYVTEEIDGIETYEPAYNLPALWITEEQRERAEALGYTVVDPPSIIATHLTEIIKRHLHELLSRQDVQTLINNVRESHPTLVEELVPKVMSIGDIQKVLMNLLRESVSIRDLVTILETLADFAHSTRDPDILTEYVREKLKRAITHKFLMKGDINYVLTLDPNVEQTIMNSVQHSEQGAFLSLDPSITRKILDKAKEMATAMLREGKQPIVLASPVVRIYFKKMIEDYIDDLIVLSYNEIDNNIEIQSSGMVSIN